MQKLALTDLVIPKQFRYEIKDVGDFPIVAYDTETINGRCELLCNSWDQHLFTKDIDSILNFMCRKKTRGHIGFFFNLKYDFNAILKHLPHEHWREIFEKGETIYKNKKKGFLIKYIPKKLLVITQLGIKKKRTWRFYDIAQYFRMSLDAASEKYLGERKLYHPFDLRHISNEIMHTRLMIKYCKIDALRTEQLAQHFIDICNKAGLQTKNFCSSASISARYFQKEIRFPTINAFLKSPEGMAHLEYAWNSVSGAFISVFKRGYIKEVHEYDINSAYPYHMSRFPDLHQGYFVFDKTRPKYATHGWVKVRINIPERNKFSYHPCLPILRHNLPNYYPIGIMDTFITLLEYDYLRKLYDVKLIDGLFWIPDNLEFPFKSTIYDIYTRRKKTKDKNINYFLKIVLNGIYGKFLEKFKVTDESSEHFGKIQTGSLFNPFVASYILAGTRIQVFDFMARLPNKNIVACFTDSVLSKEPLDIPRDPALGAWDYASTGEGLILGCGVYTIKGEKIKNKTRGFHLRNKKILNMGYTKFKDNTGDNNLFMLCEKHRNENKIPIEITENLSPMLSLIQHRPEDMNIIREKLKMVNINFDTKRLWDYYPENAGEYLEREIDSSPIIQL